MGVRAKEFNSALWTVNPSTLVVLFLVPHGQFQKHMDTVAEIAKMLHRDDFRDRLRRRFL